MLTLSELFFVSTNEHKFKEARDILSKFGVPIKFLKSGLTEIQANSLEEIALHKALDAFSKFSKPLIIEDDGLFIDSLNGFPGPYSSFVFKTIGNKGIINMLGQKRNAYFESVIAFCDQKNRTNLFSSIIKGKIAKKQLGKGWGYDPIFIPADADKTYAQTRNKNLISHRYMSLRKFANWYLHMLESNDQ